jgi:predicted PurR-regulated permease PerM
MKLTNENMKKILLLITFTVALILFVIRLDFIISSLGLIVSVFRPFIIGGIIAFILNVPMIAIENKLFGGRTLTQKKKPRARIISLLLSILLVIAILVLAVLWVVPELGRSLYNFASSLKYVAPDFINWLNTVSEGNKNLNDFISSISINFDEIFQRLETMLEESAMDILSSGVNIVSSVAGAVFSTVIGIVFACYILSQKENLNRQIKKVLTAVFPRKINDKITKILRMTYEAFYNFLSGQCIEGLITGLMFFIVLTIFNYPYAAVIAVVVGFSTLIPVFGAIIGTVIGAVFILTVDPIKVISYLIITIILQQIEGNIIYPHVVGSSLGLPSVWVLVAVTVGGSLFGIAGMILFIPITAVFYQLFREWINNRINEKGEALPEKL